MKIKITDKVYSDTLLASQKVQEWKDIGNEVVFTNGCFDVFHNGHLEVLQKSSILGDKLIVGLNSDFSVSKIKGKNRPIYNEMDRAMILASITFVDMVVLFKEETPLELISCLIPDVLVKGGDYKKEEIVGAEIVTQHGGEVKIVDILEGYSTSKIIKKLKSLN